MKEFVHRNMNRFTNAFRGIHSALRTDLNFQIQLFLGPLVIVVVWLFLKPLREIEILILLLSWVLILITELQNSAFERALDRLHPELHDTIGASKDMAAGAVLIAAFFALGVVVWIVLPHIS